MNSKLEEKRLAIKLRKSGYSYSEMLGKVNVSRSTLSEWLRKVKITNLQIERLRSKNAAARKLGSVELKRKRIEKTKIIIDEAKLEIDDLDNRHLKVIGAMLYWAEGSKQNDNELSKELIFTNSDSIMVRIYLLWLEKCLLVKSEDIKFEIYIHETYTKTSKELSLYWSEVTKFPTKVLNKIYIKKNKVKSFRKNNSDKYFGVLE